MGRWHFTESLPVALKALTTLASQLKFGGRFANFNTTGRDHGHEECLRSIAAERDGTDATGGGSGGPAVGGTAALRRKRNGRRPGEASLGDRRQRTGSDRS